MIASCAITAPATNDNQTQAVTTSSQQNTESPSLPVWVRHPELEGYEVVIGSAPRQEMGGIEVQRHVAERMAHQELSYRLRAHVKSTDVLITEKDSRNPQLTQETQIRAQAGYKVNRFKIDKEWIDPESGTLFLRMLVPVEPLP